MFATSPHTILRIDCTYSPVPRYGLHNARNESMPPQTDFAIFHIRSIFYLLRNYFQTNFLFYGNYKKIEDETVR